ncbi:MAG: hypothetical protein G01um101470_570 [Parcubacteria group bacterium Gr01-1014_70]|nr:MAG: hypothetical protein G01um101470_570 [Parcubacteria group bacterium Gr01-1014_70]
MPRPRKKSTRSVQEEIVSRFIHLLKDEYIVVEKSRIPFWKVGLLFGVCLGIIITFSFLASRSGDLQQSEASSFPIGFHDHNNDPNDSSDTAQCQIRGWAVDPDNRNTDVGIYVYADGGSSPVRSGRANRFRQDLLNAWNRDSSTCPGGTCAFKFNLTSSLGPGDHTITVKAVDLETKQRVELAGTPKQVRCRVGETDVFTEDLTNGNKVWPAHRPFNPANPLYGPFGELPTTPRWHVLQWNAAVELAYSGNTQTSMSVEDSAVDGELTSSDLVPSSASDGNWEALGQKSGVVTSHSRVVARKSINGTSYTLSQDTRGQNFISCSVSDEFDLLLGPNMEEHVPQYPQGLLLIKDRPSLGASGLYRLTVEQRVVHGMNDTSTCTYPNSLYGTIVGLHFKNMRTGKHFQYQITNYDSRLLYAPAGGYWYDADGADTYCGKNDDIVYAYGKTRLVPGSPSEIYDLEVESKLASAIMNAPVSCWGAESKNLNDWKPSSYYIGSYINGKAYGASTVFSSRLYVR